MEKEKNTPTDIGAFRNIDTKLTAREQLRNEYAEKLQKTKERVEFLEGLEEAYKAEGYPPFVQLGGIVDDLELLNHDKTGRVLDLLHEIYGELQSEFEKKVNLYS